MTELERKQVVVEVLLEIIKALSAVGPQVGMVSHSFAKLAGYLVKRAEDLTQEMRRLAR